MASPPPSFNRFFFAVQHGNLLTGPGQLLTGGAGTALNTNPIVSVLPFRMRPAISTASFLNPVVTQMSDLSSLSSPAPRHATLPGATVEEDALNISASARGDLRGAIWEPPLQAILTDARTAFATIGLDVTRLRYTIAPDQKAPGHGVWILFDAETANREYFGDRYSNQRRMELLGDTYRLLYGSAHANLSGAPFWLDTFVTLRASDAPAASAAPGAHGLNGMVDVNTDNQVEFLTVQDAISRGELKPGSPLEAYCARYGGSHVLKHGPHYISPDPITVEALEAFVTARGTRSFLEIGSGVGLSASIAKREGFEDFRFVDLNPEVVAYLSARNPGKVVHSDAFDYRFDRQWDLVQLGLPYELVPHFLERRGAELARMTDAVVIQSGCLTFFEFEHAWMKGDARFGAWPWYRPEQSLTAHFPYVIESTHGFQTCLIGSTKPLDDVVKAMRVRGFEPPAYRQIEHTADQA